VVLLVSSDRGRLLDLADVLSVEFEVTFAVDAREAAAELVRRTPTVVLTDLAVGGMKGPTFVRWLRTRRGGTRAPVAVLADDSNAHASALAIQAGAQAVIDAGVPARELLDKVRRLVRRSQPVPRGDAMPIIYIPKAPKVG